MFEDTLKDDIDINKQIQNACVAFATMKSPLTNIKLDAKIQIRVYDITVISILLWRSES